MSILVSSKKARNFSFGFSLVFAGDNYGGVNSSMASILLWWLDPEEYGNELMSDIHNYPSSIVL